MSKTIFWHTAIWCSPCKALKPIAKRIAAELGATLIEVDVDVQQPIIPEVLGVPTAVIYDTDVSGSEPVAILGPSFLTAKSLRKALE